MISSSQYKIISLTSKKNNPLSGDKTINKKRLRNDPDVTTIFRIIMTNKLKEQM